MTKRLLAILLLLTVSLRGYTANPDDAAWLIYDISYGDYFLLRVDMQTTRTGSATIAGGNKYAGRRHTDQFGRFGVSILNGQVSINKDGAKPFMVGVINARGDEYSGEFLAEDGSSAGQFVGALQGFTTVQMDLFQLCKNGKNVQCVNRGRDERCDNGSAKYKSTFFTEQNCFNAGGIPTLASPQTGEPATEPKSALAEDPTGTWLFYDKRFEEHVIGRLVATNMDTRKPEDPIEGTFVFSGVYYGWDEPDTIFNGHVLYFGRRKLGNSALDDDERDTFSIRMEDNEIMFLHGFSSAFWGKADLAAGKMAGSFQAGNRKPIAWDDYRDLGPGYWTAEKKSDDPNFDLPLYQVCASKHGIESFSRHWCVKVSDVRADGSNRPHCAIGYDSGSITFLSGNKCAQLVRAKRQIQKQR